ncbi:Gldg family protein [soil metagenome]
MTTLQNQPTEAPDVTPESRPEPSSQGPSLPLRPFVVGAICRRDLSRYFTNVAGYVFIVLFILASSVAAFWPAEFFANNLATLDQLNRMMPYLLLLFIPAVTMSIWAEERRQGTDELLLTLPARDVEVVLGKYLASLGIYTVALAFLAVGLTGVLNWLGAPDWGVMFANFLGYWLMGAMLLTVGMVASLLSSNVTVAFILGALFCSVPVFAELLGGMGDGLFSRAIRGLSVPEQFREFGRGVIPLAGLVYFAALAVAMLYINIVLLGRRHWAGGEQSAGKWGHAAVRIVSLIVALGSFSILIGLTGLRADVSKERLNSLSDESRRLIREISRDRPVYIQAFLSPEVPRDYVETRQQLISMIRSFDSIGGDRIRLNLVETERYSDEAREAEKQFGITPRRVFVDEEARQGFDEIFLGVAVTSGTEEVVIPFFDRGLPVEYELTRSIRVASGAERRTIGILATDANLLGGFDFRMMGQNPEWQIVTELRKQYEVVPVSADAPIGPEIDALLVAQPSSLPQPQIDILTDYIRDGGPALLFLDPLPRSDRSMQMSLIPSQPREPPGGMFGGGPTPEPKGDLRPLLDRLGLEWPDDLIAWDTYNPHKKHTDFPEEFVFVSPNSGVRDAFNPNDPISSDLQEVILIYPGLLRFRGTDGPDFTPLMRTTEQSGTVRFNQILSSGMFGLQLNPARVAHIPTNQAYTLAARLQGPLAGAESGDREIHVIAVADLDMISDVFFTLRETGSEEFAFDNVTFVLNCVDSLLGDESFLELRKRRKRYRTLTTLERQDQIFEAQRLEQEAEAEAEAEAQLDAARDRMRDAVAQIESNVEIDDRTKQIMLANRREGEQRRLEVAEVNIEDEKQRRIKESFAAKEREIRQIRSQVRLCAILLPPLPAIILAGLVFIGRAGRENKGASPNRLA